MSGLTRTEIDCGLSLGRRDGRELIELGFGFHIDAENAFIDRERELGLGLADAGEHDLVARHAGQPRAHQFAARDHVGAGAELGERRDHRLVGIRLHGVADQRVDVGEGAGKHLVVPFQRRGGIAVERRRHASWPARRDEPPRRSGRRRDRQSGASPAQLSRGSRTKRFFFRRSCSAPAFSAGLAGAPCSPATEAAGGGSSGPLRPQPASARAATKTPIRARQINGRLQNTAQDLRSSRHHSKPANQGEVRISPFRASAAISWPAPARFWAPCRQNSSGSSPSGRPRGR